MRSRFFWPCLISFVEITTTSYRYRQTISTARQNCRAVIRLCRQDNAIRHIACCNQTPECNEQLDEFGLIEISGKYLSCGLA